MLLIPIALLASLGRMLIRTGLDVIDGNAAASAAALRPSRRASRLSVRQARDGFGGSGWIIAEVIIALIAAAYFLSRAAA